DRGITRDGLPVVELVELERALVRSAAPNELERLAHVEALRRELRLEAHRDELALERDPAAEVVVVAAVVLEVAEAAAARRLERGLDALAHLARVRALAVRGDHERARFLLGALRAVGVVEVVFRRIGLELAASVAARDERDRGQCGQQSYNPDLHGFK